MTDTTTTVTAAAGGTALTIHATGRLTAAAASRTLAGPLVRYGYYGRTSAGRLRVAPGALHFPEDLSRVKLTREHDRGESRGHLVSVEDDGTTLRVTCRVSDGPDGDAALTEAADHTRDGFSFDLVDVELDGDSITSALPVAIGQVGIPAYDDMRIDTIAASTPTPGAPMLTEEQRARLDALAARTDLTPDEQIELAALQALAGTNDAGTNDAGTNDAGTNDAGGQAPPAGSASAGAATQVAASVPAVPGSVPPPTAGVHAGGGAVTRPRGGALQAMVAAVTAGLQSQSVTAITAALADITNTAHNDNIEAPAWSGELWSGLQYEPEWVDLYSAGTLTSFEGRGWRFTKKLEIKDYAGDKAEIPTDTVTTAPSTYEAARMAVGVDIDRKFYDFPNEGFVNSLFEQVRESWTIKLDAKVRAYTTANAVAVMDGGSPLVAPTILKAAARASMALKRRRVGRAQWIVVNDEDMFTLLDYAEKDIPAFLDLWQIEPRNFRSSPDVAQGTVLAGVRPAAVVRTLPGSPIRVSAQNLVNGGVDEAFFGYWAIEQHHTQGIASVQYEAPVAEPTP